MRPACPATGPAHVGFCSHAAGGWRTVRHDDVKAVIVELASEAGISVTSEDRATRQRNPNTGRADKSRTDVRLQNLIINSGELLGKPVTKMINLHIDTTVVEGACPTAIEGGSHTTRGVWAEKAAHEKTEHYTTLVGARNEKFLPAAVELGGYLHPHFRKILRLMAEHVTNNAQLGTDMSKDDLNILRGTILNGYYQRISIALVDASMRCILSTVNGLSKNLPFNITNASKGDGGSTLRYVRAKAQTLIGNAERAASSNISL
jgi:hypothetical protein